MGRCFEKLWYPVPLPTLHSFICISETREFLLSSICYSLSPSLFNLMIEWSQIWPLHGPVCMRQHTRHSLYFLCSQRPCPWDRPSLPGPWLRSLEDGVRSQVWGVRCAHCCWGVAAACSGNQNCPLTPPSAGVSSHPRVPSQLCSSLGGQPALACPTPVSAASSSCWLHLGPESPLQAFPLGGHWRGSDRALGLLPSPPHQGL